MRIDFVLPTVLFMVTMSALQLHPKLEKRVKSAFKTEFRYRDIIVIIAILIATVKAVAVAPETIVTIAFLCYFSYVLYSLTHVVIPTSYLAILPPALFITLYTFSWNMFLLNLFSIIVAIFLAICSSALLRWKKTVFLAGLLAVADSFLVFGSLFMIHAAKKLVGLQLPLFIIVPTFPSTGQVVLGLGDVFLSGLLTIQTTQKSGRKTGVSCALLITIFFLLGETILLNCPMKGFPATVILVAGWLTTLVLSHTCVQAGLKRKDARAQVCRCTTTAHCRHIWTKFVISLRERLMTHINSLDVIV